MAAIKVLTRHSRRILNSRGCSYFVRQDVWTPDNVVRSPFRDVEIPNSTIPEHIWKNLDKWATNIAVICGVTNHFYTYAELYKYSGTFAVNLRKKLKISDGDVVCIMMHNSPDYAVAALGVMEAGAELTTVNPIYTAHEVQRQLTLSNPKVVIASNKTVKVIKEALSLTKKELPIITVKLPGEALPLNTIDFQELAQDKKVDMYALDKVRRKSEDIAILPYSSGTTGLPKGVELTHRNIVANFVQQDVEGTKQYQYTTGSYQDSILAVLPFYHIYGISIVLFHKLSTGGKVVTLPTFQPESFLSTLKNHKISLLYAAPPLILFLGSHPNVKKEHLRSINKIMCGAAPLAKPDIMRALEKMPSADLIQVYGLTETSPLATTMVAGSTKYTSAGYPISNTELKVIDPDSRTLGPNEVGELLIRGPQVMKGYRNNPEATRASITEDGWFKSGDLAFLDKDGTVTIADRLKELIKVKGYQVPPAELESVLKEHPAVFDAGVVGIPDPRTGEAPKAFVVLNEGFKEDRKDIMEFVKDRVAEFKRIKEVVFLDALPKNPSGKLLRRVLKEKYC